MRCPTPTPTVPRPANSRRLLPADETQLLYSLVLHGRQELNLAPDSYAALTMVLLRLMAFAPASARRRHGPGAAGRAGTRGRPGDGDGSSARCDAGQAAVPAPRQAAASEPPAWLDEAPDEFEVQAVREPAPRQPSRRAPASRCRWCRRRSASAGPASWRCSNNAS